MSLHLPASLNPRSSLRARFALLIGGSGLALALVTAAVVDGYQRAQLVEVQGEGMRREALLLGRNLDAALQQHLQQLRHTAAHPLLGSGMFESGDARVLLEGVRSQQPALAWLAIVDPRGRVVVATNALLEGALLGSEPGFTQALQAPWIGLRRPAGALTVHLGLQDGQPPYLIDMGLPLVDIKGQHIGVLAARLRWDWLAALHRSMQAPDAQRPGTESLVLDRAGRVLLGPASWLDRPLLLPGLDTLQTGGAPRVLNWPGEGEYVTAWAAADRPDAAAGTGLSVLVRQPAALAFRSADVLRHRLLLLGSVATLAFLALSIWMAGRVARPIRGLSAAALRVVDNAPPDFVAISPRRKDEVAELARALGLLHAELSRRLAEQQRATERYESLFRSAPVAVCVMVDNRLQLANEACLQLFGAATLADLVGMRSEDLCAPEDHALVVQSRRAQTAMHPDDPPVAAIEHRIQRLDGGRAMVESMAMPLAGSNGHAVQVVLHDVTAQRRAQALLVEREAQLLQTSTMARVGGWSLDLKTRQATWTDELARIYELPVSVHPTAELALSYFHGEDRQRLQQAIALLLRDGEPPYDLELQLRTPAGHVKWVRAYARAIVEDGRAVRLEGMTQDITDRRAAQEALRDLNAQLERRVAERTAALRAANEELDAFAYAVSHDLRAPLRAMSGFSQALVEDHGPQLDASAREHLQQIVHASQRMGDLIEGLLALSRSLRGTLHSDDVDLSALAAAVVADLRRADPGRQVLVDIQGDLHAQGDRRMLAAMLGNLLGNAWKYTGRSAHPCIRFMARDIDGERWFVVSDNGAGFDMAHAGRLFKVFARLHRHDEFPGLGIGLATVQRIVRRHGGQILAEAAPGAGATFRFTLHADRTTELHDNALP